MDKDQKRARILDGVDWVGKNRHEDTKLIRNLLVDLIIKQEKTNKHLANISSALEQIRIRTVG